MKLDGRRAAADDGLQAEKHIKKVEGENARLQKKLKDDREKFKSKMKELELSAMSAVNCVERRSSRAWRRRLGCRIVAKLFCYAIMNETLTRGRYDMAISAVVSDHCAWLLQPTDNYFASYHSRSASQIL